VQLRGYSHRWIAQALNQPVGTIKTRIRLGLRKLRDLLQDEQPARERSAEALAAYALPKPSET
jgi:DNA-directed RNA polymerase specialized sigma24 family protein